jgi:uncharacterized protein
LNALRLLAQFNSLYLVSIELVLALILGLGWVALGASGGAWILGGIAAGAIVFCVYRSRFNPQAQPNRNSRKVGQILVGLTIGFSIQHSNLSALSTQLPIFGVLTLFLLGCGSAIGFLYARIENTNILTATLATVPGNIGVMASLAADHGSNTALVSLVQLIRFTAIILIVPFVAKVFNTHDIGVVVNSFSNQLLNFDLSSLVPLMFLFAIAAIVIHFCKKLQVPVAAFLGAIVTGLLFNALPWDFLAHFTLPPVVNLIGQILLGITIGEYWGISPKLKYRTIAYALIPVTLTFLAGFLTASTALFLTDWDWLTCLLVASPGGSPEMILIALTLHHNVEVVTAGHLVRLLTINLLLPGLISLASYLDDRVSQTPHHPTPKELS